MSNLTLKLDVLCGTDRSEALSEVWRAGRRIGVNVEFDFNGSNFFVPYQGYRVLEHLGEDSWVWVQRGQKWTRIESEA